MADFLTYKSDEIKLSKPESEQEEVLDQTIRSEEQSQKDLTSTTKEKTFTLAKMLANNKPIITSQPTQTQSTPSVLKGSEDYEKAWQQHLINNPDDAKYKHFFDRIAKIESNYKSVQNYGGAPAYGYFQLWETNLGGYSPEDVLNDPEKQIKLAMQLYQNNLRTFTDQDYEQFEKLGYTRDEANAAAWFSGVGGARAFLNGEDRSDSHHSPTGQGNTVSQYIAKYRNLKDGGTLSNLIPIKIGDKEYKVQIAKSTEEKELGLSNIDNLPEDQGMLFLISDRDKDADGFIPFVMDETSIPLDIIYLNGDLKVVKKRTMEAFSKEIIYGEADYVLEVNPNSGIDFNDELEFITDSEEINNKMMVLGPKGEVQMELEGGERIVSRKETITLLKKANKANILNNDSSYKSLGKYIFKVLNGQDNREPEYVEKKD